MLASLPLRRLWPIAFAAAVAIGAVLRLIWVTDMEYKEDEIYLFERTQHVGRDEPWPWFGMPSSVNLRNPGMSVWVFLVLSKICAADEPTALCRGVMVLNVAAILLLVAFAVWCIPAGEREPWLWAAALAGVNPLAVAFHRKIWSQSVLPVFSMLFLWAWWHRHRRWGAFAWGLIGAGLGQIHMSGFFLAAGFVIWAGFFDRRRVCWASWLLGSSLGILPLIPWIHYLFTEGLWEEHPSSGGASILLLTFWRFWVLEPLGFGLDYWLEEDIWDFLRYPLIAGHATYLVVVSYGLIIAAGLAILAQAGLRLWRDRRSWRDWRSWRDMWIGRSSATAFTLNAAWWGYGALLTASNVTIQYFYLIVAFPLTFVWLSRQALGPPDAGTDSQRRGRLLLAALWFVELLLTISFLGYIHVNEGTPHAKGYGPAYHTRLPTETRQPAN